MEATMLFVIIIMVFAQGLHLTQKLNIPTVKINTLSLWKCISYTLR